MTNQIEEQTELRRELFRIFGGTAEIGQNNNGTWYLYKPGLKIPQTGEHYDESNVEVIAELESLFAKQKEEWEKEMAAWIEHGAPITSVQGIKPLEDGQYVKVKNLIGHLSSKEKERE